MTYDYIRQSILPSDFYCVDALQNYLHYGIIRKYAKGSSVIMPGDFANAIIYVIKGKVRNVIVRENGDDILFYIAHEKHIISKLFALKSDNLHSVAMEDSELCFFSKDVLKKIFAENDELAFDFFKSYMSKVNYFKNKLYITNLSTSVAKIHRLIYLLAMRDDAVEGEDFHINLGISQKTIAEMLDVHPVTVSKEINLLRDRGIISSSRKSLIVHDLAALHQLVNEDEKLLD